MAEALYRKYRPQVFADVVGQEHIVRTLQNAVEQGKVSHAYLFCGPRGTGKTTMARLLSKALLCQMGAVPNPDGTCEDCKLIAAGSHPDVYELDAASRTGVENVREEIIGRVQFAPTRGAQKIYIIDEVHMLSTAAFSALLKTLEEPPSHVVFVLCTTDPQKVPETIHSRCQRFDFRRIGQEAMVAKLGAICVAEGAQFEGEALELVAHRADGGMRNALTTLEQLIAFSGGTITMAAAEDMLGGLDSSDVAELVAAIGQRDAGACFTWLARYVETGGDLAQFARDLAEHVRNLYVMSLAGADVPLEVSDAARGQMAQELQWFGSDRLARALCVLGDLMAELKTSTNARLSFEIACIRLTRPATDLTLESLAERIESLERNGVVASAPAPSMQSAAAASEKPAAASARNEAAARAAQPAGRAVAQASEPDRVRPAAAETRQTSSVDPWHSGLTSSTNHDESPARQTAGAASAAQAQRGAQPQAAAQAQAKPQEQPQSRPRSSAEREEPASQTPSQEMTGGNAANGGAWAKAAQNPAALQRLWQQVMGSLKKDKSAYAVLFMNTRAVYDEQREILCVEFPKEAVFAFKAVQKPDVIESLSAAVAATLGVPAPFCFVQAGAVAAARAQQGGTSRTQQGLDNRQEPASASRQASEAVQRKAEPARGGDVQQGQPRPEQAQQQPRPEQRQRAESHPAPERQRPVDDGYDEVPLDLYDDFAVAQDDRYGYSYESPEPASRPQNEARAVQPAQPATRQAAREDAAAAPAQADPDVAKSADAPQPDPAADAAWQGNLEDAFGPVSVQRL